MLMGGEFSTKTANLYLRYAFHKLHTLETPTVL